MTFLPSRSYASSPKLGLPRLYSVGRINRVRGDSLRGVSPYGPIGFRPAVLTIKVVDDTLASFDGKSFQLGFPLGTSYSAFAQQGFTFDDDTNPPTTGSTIKIGTLTTEAQIAEQIALAINLTVTSRPHAFHAVQSGALVTVYSNAGSRGNNGANVFTGFEDLLVVNGLDDFTLQPLFHGGADLDIPARWGQNYAFLPSNADTPIVEAIS